MDPIYRKFMIRRLATARQKSCYINIQKLTVEHNVDYTVNNNGVLFDLSPLPDELVRQIDDILVSLATQGSQTCGITAVVFCRARSTHVVCLLARILLLRVDQQHLVAASGTSLVSLSCSN